MLEYDIFWPIYYHFEEPKTKNHDISIHKNSSNLKINWSKYSSTMFYEKLDESVSKDQF